MKAIVAGLSLLLALVALPAAAQKAYLDYDSSVDFKALETFRWVETGAPSLERTDPLLHRHIVEAIISTLEEGGLTRVESDADFLITYHGESQTEVRIDNTSYGYGYGRGWRMGGYGAYGSTSSHVRTYEKGTLIIDAWDGDSKELIWRGTATSTKTDNPDKARKRIDKSIQKIVKKWEKEHRGR